MNRFLLYTTLFTASAGYCQLSYAPNASTEGTTAIEKSSSVFTAWATGCEVVRGYVQISDPNITHNGSNMASYGVVEDAIGLPAEGALSLGDGGVATLTFAAPIANGEGFDFAVFENGTDTFLELAFVEVSSNGVDFFRFPSHSETQTDTPIGGFGALDARNLNNLAGKYRIDYGTPFDLDELPDASVLDKNHITHVRIIDVVGSLEAQYATYDSYGNMVNDPYPTPFYSSGFDLTGVGVINQGSLGIKNSQKLSFALYPNPAKNLLHVDLEGSGTAEIKLYDIAGRCVLAQSLNSTNVLNISGLSAGTYLTGVTRGNNLETIRVVIQ